jgi:hypothetical protein
VVLALWATIAGGQAAPAVESERLEEPGGQVGDGFGRRVAVSGDTMLVGMNGDDDEGVDAGAVIVYRRVDGHWQRVQKLGPAILETGDFFGWSVALDGDVAVVGAPGDDRIISGGSFVATTANRGAAYVFRREPHGFFALEARLEGWDAQPFDEFGGRVAVSGDSVLVSGIYHRLFNRNNAGAVWTFRRVNGVWIDEWKLGGAPFLPGGNGRFGFSLAMEGDLAAIGEPDNETVWVYTRHDNGSWTSTPVQPVRVTSQDGLGVDGRVAGVYGFARGPDDTLFLLEFVRPDYVLRRIDAEGRVVTLGTVTAIGDEQGANAYNALCVDGAGNAYVNDVTRILRRTPAGGVTVLAGGAAPGTGDGVGPSAGFSGVSALACTTGGTVIASEGTRLRRIDPDGTVVTLAGGLDAGAVDDTGLDARFQAIQAITVHDDGTVYVADVHAIRRVSAAGVVTTLAGVIDQGGLEDGVGPAARFFYPRSMSVTSSHTLVVSEGGSFRRVTPAGEVTTLALTQPFGFFEQPADGDASVWRFSAPFVVAREDGGAEFVDDGRVASNATVVRRLTVEGTIVSRVGLPHQLYIGPFARMFGYSVALIGQRLFVGAPIGTPPLSSAANGGYAWVFDFDGAAWSPGLPVWSTGTAPQERLGEALTVTAAGEIVLGGANGCTWVAPATCTDTALGTPSESSGTPARLFRLVRERWVEVAQLEDDRVAPRTGFGATLAVGDRDLMVGAPGASLFPSDTAGEVFVFDLATLDSDGDSLPDDWELQFGLDATSASGADGAAGDPDGDGQTNVAERAAHAHPTNLPSATRYLAEGATGFFEMRVSIANAGSEPASVLLRFLKADGSLASHALTVPAQQSRKVAVGALPAMASAEFSTVVEADRPVIVDRQMWWSAGTAYGTHAETSVAAPALTWYFAEGATHSGFDLFYLLQNPRSLAADVRVRYLRPVGLPLEKTYTVPPHSRTTIWVDMEEFPAGSGQRTLGATDVAAVIDVTNDVPIIAERAMYRSAGGTAFEAGHESAGITAPATTWVLAEGATGPYFDTFLLLANPSPTAAAEVLASYLLPDGTTHSKTYLVAPSTRTNIWLDLEEFDGPTGTTAALADTAVSTTLTVTNGVPIVVERSMWWPGPTADAWLEAHNAFGATAAASRWGFAEGIVLGPPTNTDTYFLIANTASTPARVRVTLLFDDGGPAVEREFDLLGRSRFSVAVAAEFPEAFGRGFGAVVESVGTPMPLVVERAMYNDAGGIVWRAGSNALGTPLP